MTNQLTVSKFKNARDTVPVDVSLGDWLKDTMNPEHPNVIKVLKYRVTKNKEYKKSIPCITISSRLNEYRSLENIVEKHNLICFDIDRYSKDPKKASNDCIDMGLVKEFFKKHPCVYYCGYSTGNDGVYVIMRIKHNDRLKEYFDYFKEKLQLRGINIDNGCSDYTRLRFFSFDPDGYLNNDAKYFDLTPRVIRTPKVNSNVKKSDIEKIESIIEIATFNGIDITGGYEDWVRIGAALGSIGEIGREYFHQISKISPQYKEKECNSKFTSCLRLNKTGLGTFFLIATDHGVRF